MTQRLPLQAATFGLLAASVSFAKCGGEDAPWLSRVASKNAPEAEEAEEAESVGEGREGTRSVAQGEPPNEDDFNDEKWNLRPEKSEAKYQHPSHRGIYVVCTDTFDEIVLDDDKDVLVEVWADWCVSCKAIAPVYNQSAVALLPIDTVKLTQFNGAKNHKKGLLVGEERYSSPNFKLFPAGKKGSPVAYHGPPNATALLGWIHANCTHKFDLQQALQRAQNTELIQQTRSQYEQFHQTQISAAVRAMPCGVLWTQTLEAYHYWKHIPCEEHEKEHERWANMLKPCLDRERKNIIEYWESTKEDADAFLEGMKRKEEEANEGKGGVDH